MDEFEDVSFNKSLINLVQQYPILYNGCGKSEDKMTKWLEISHQLNAKGITDSDVTTIQTKWKNMRDNYVRNHRKVVQNKKFKPCSHFNDLHFLSNFICHKEIPTANGESIDCLRQKSKDYENGQNPMAVIKGNQASTSHDPDIAQIDLMKPRVLLVENVKEKLEVNNLLKRSPVFISNIKKEVDVSLKSIKISEKRDALKKVNDEAANRIVGRKQSVFHNFPIKTKNSQLGNKFEDLVMNSGVANIVQKTIRDNTEFKVPENDNYKRSKKQTVSTEIEEKCLLEIHDLMQILKKYYNTKHSSLLQRIGVEGESIVQNSIVMRKEALPTKGTIEEEMCTHYERLLLQKFDEVPDDKKSTTLLEMITEIKRLNMEG